MPVGTSDDEAWAATQGAMCVPAASPCSRCEAIAIEISKGGLIDSPICVDYLCQ